MPVKKSVDVKDVVTYTKQEMEKMDEYFKGKNVETAYMIESLQLKEHRMKK